MCPSYGTCSFLMYLVRLLLNAYTLPHVPHVCCFVDVEVCLVKGGFPFLVRDVVEVVPGLIRGVVTNLTNEAVEFETGVISEDDEPGAGRSTFCGG